MRLGCARSPRRIRWCFVERHWRSQRTTGDHPNVPSTSSMGSSAYLLHRGERSHSSRTCRETCRYIHEGACSILSVRTEHTNRLFLRLPCIIDGLSNIHPSAERMNSGITENYSRPCITRECRRSRAGWMVLAMTITGGGLVAGTAFCAGGQRAGRAVVAVELGAFAFSLMKAW